MGDKERHNPPSQESRPADQARLMLNESGPVAPVDERGYGKRVGEIIARAIRSLRNRSKGRSRGGTGNT
jgi:hypothetical protein